MEKQFAEPTTGRMMGGTCSAGEAEREPSGSTDKLKRYNGGEPYFDASRTRSSTC